MQSAIVGRAVPEWGETSPQSPMRIALGQGKANKMKVTLETKLDGIEENDCCSIHYDSACLMRMRVTDVSNLQYIGLHHRVPFNGELWACCHGICWCSHYYNQNAYKQTGLGIWFVVEELWNTLDREYAHSERGNEDGNALIPCIEAPTSNHKPSVQGFFLGGCSFKAIEAHPFA